MTQECKKRVDELQRDIRDIASMHGSRLEELQKQLNGGMEREERRDRDDGELRVQVRQLSLRLTAAEDEVVDHDERVEKLEYRMAVAHNGGCAIEERMQETDRLSRILLGRVKLMETRQVKGAEALGKLLRRVDELEARDARAHERIHSLELLREETWRRIGKLESEVTALQPKPYDIGIDPAVPGSDRTVAAKQPTPPRDCDVRALWIQFIRGEVGVTDMPLNPWRAMERTADYFDRSVAQVKAALRRSLELDPPMPAPPIGDTPSDDELFAAFAQWYSTHGAHNAYLSLMKVAKHYNVAPFRVQDALRRVVKHIEVPVTL